MAQGKKSFILYCDLIHTVEKMPDEKAGLLLKHILRYVNDLNPISDDMIIDLVFEPIKQQMKRDLKQWENRADKSRENGKLGGRPKKTKKPKETQETHQVILEPKKPDTVTVTVTDNVTDIKEELTHTDSIPEMSEFVTYGLSLINKNEAYRFSIEAKYESWVENKWKDGNGSKIKNWKTKLKNTIPYLKPMGNEKVAPSTVFKIDTNRGKG